MRILLAALVVSMATNVAVIYKEDKSRSGLKQAEAELATFVNNCLVGIPMRLNETQVVLCRAQVVTLGTR